MALIGKWVFKAGGVTMYSPTFSRRGLGAVFNASTLAKLGSPTLQIFVEHKNRNDTSFAALGNFSAISTLGNFEVDLSGIKEEVRFAYSFVSTTNDWEGFLLLITPVAWRPYA